MPDWERYVRDRLPLAGIRPERERRIVRELAASLEDLYADARANGLDAQAAEAAAAAHIEDWERLAADLRQADPSAIIPRLDQIAERLEVRDARRKTPGVWACAWRGLPLDVVVGLRRLRSAPVFTLVAILIVALGVGATAAMFTVVDTFLFRPLPIPRPHEVVRVFEGGGDGPPGTCSYPTVLDVAALDHVFASVTGSIVGRDATWLRDDGEMRRVAIDFIGAPYFGVMGLPLAMGRTFTAAEDATGGPPAAIVSHRLWREAFGSDPAVVGRIIRLSGAAVSIAGVAPPNFDGIVAGHRVDFWLSLSGLGPVWGEYAGGTLQRRGDHWFNVLARLAPGATTEQARAAVELTAARLALEFPEHHKGRTLEILRAADVRVQPGLDAEIYPAGAMLMGVAGLVLLVGCTNLAGLLLARGWQRGHELAIRLALGSNRWRLVRQLLVESLLLGLAGGLAGLLLAVWGARALAAGAAGLSLPLQVSVSIDARAALFTVVLSLLTGVAFGIAPALRVTGVDLVAGLKGPESTVSATPRRTGARRLGVTLRGAFIVVQVAASMVLLVAAGLLARGVREAQQTTLGFGAAGRLAFLQADPAQAGLDEARTAALMGGYLDRVRALPGVERVSATTRLPVSRGGSSTLVIEEYRVRTGAETVEVDFAWVVPGYFETLGIPLRHGRLLEEADAARNRRVAVVSEAMARRYWGRSDAVGLRYRHQGSPDSWVEVVGVVGDVRVNAPIEPPVPQFYRALPAVSWPRLVVVARSSGLPEPVAAAMQRAFREMYPGVPVVRAGTMASHVAESLSLERAAAATVGVFGAIALVLAGIGLYGAVSTSVAQRAPEVGIRMALGAQAGQVVAMLVREEMGLVAIGAALGLGAALAIVPALRSLMAGLPAGDPITLAMASALLAAVSLVATWIPARRAVALAPLLAIRR
ncbi:MAG: ADOP family duplicated permease [Acidobacteriota bacterium]